MTVRELREMLEEYDDNSRVLFEPVNSGGYVESFENAIGHRPITAFYGNDYEAIILVSGGQVGSR